MPRRLLLFACLIGLAVPASAQLTPDAPLEHFRLPMFGASSYKTWEIEGAQGRYLSEGDAEITRLVMTIYSGRADLQVLGKIEAPLARVDLTRRTATGQTGINLEGPGFVLDGTRWRWDGPARKLEVHEKARLTIADRLILLK